MEDAMNTKKYRQYVKQIRENVKLADLLEAEWVYVVCTQCYYQRKVFSDKFIAELASKAVKHESEKERIEKIADAIKNHLPISAEDEKWWHASCK